jgi:hypothetical protein
MNKKICKTEEIVKKHVFKLDLYRSIRMDISVIQYYHFIHIQYYHFIHIQYYNFIHIQYYHFIHNTS